MGVWEMFEEGNCLEMCCEVVGCGFGVFGCGYGRILDSG